MVATRSDQVSKSIPASPGSIYRALMDASARVQWLPPSGMKAAIDEFDPSVGGSYRMTLSYENAGSGRGKTSATEDVVRGRFVELVPDARVVEAIDFESDDRSFAGTMTMTWSIAAVPDGAKVTVTATDVPSGISREDHEAGMRSSLENLAAFLESSQGS